MNLSQRIIFLCKTIWNDLFGEEPQGEIRKVVSGDLTTERVSALLNDAQRHLDRLRLELAHADAQQKRIAQAWQDVLAQITTRQATVDDALRADNDEEARKRLEQIVPLQKHADELAELTRQCAQHTAEIRAAVSNQQLQLDTLRRKALLLENRESNLAMLTELFGSQQSLNRRTNDLQNDLTTWQEQIARREDQLAARREWSK